MKLKHLLLAMLVALFAACTNQESLLKDYEKACQNGESIKATQILVQMQKKYPNDADWTEEQQERILEASMTLNAKAAEKVGGMIDAIDGLSDMFDSEDKDDDNED
ncbi:MAG: hypothetical protein IJU35_07400 [Paludibacteraceae bacterium]|nr:hypothetical protein [Paludibacteraceae bacterium]